MNAAQSFIVLAVLSVAVTGVILLRIRFSPWWSEYLKQRLAAAEAGMMLTRLEKEWREKLMESKAGRFTKLPVTIDAIPVSEVYAALQARRFNDDDVMPPQPVAPDWVALAIEDGTVSLVMTTTSGRREIDLAVAEMMPPAEVAAAADMIMVRTLEGWLYGRPDDWLIRGTKGELYPCKPDIFASIYVPAIAAEPEASSFERDLASLINRYSLENGSNTPDWLLAEYLMNCLAGFNRTISERERMAGRGPQPVVVHSDLGVAAGVGKATRVKIPHREVAQKVEGERDTVKHPITGAPRPYVDR